MSRRYNSLVRTNGCRVHKRLQWGLEALKRTRGRHKDKRLPWGQETVVRTRICYEDKRRPRGKKAVVRKRGRHEDQRLCERKKPSWGQDAIMMRRGCHVDMLLWEFLPLTRIFCRRDTLVSASRTVTVRSQENAAKYTTIIITIKSVTCTTKIIITIVK
jgi:hypothetical protein